MDHQGLSEVKSLLKPIIISSPRGMTLEQLNRDYRNIVGQDVPYKKLGFTSLESFCRAINDTLLVIGSGSQAKVFTVSTEKTQHLEYMISKQNKKSKRGAAPPRSKFSDPSPWMKATISAPPVSYSANQNTSSVTAPKRSSHEQKTMAVTTSSVPENKPSLVDTTKQNLYNPVTTTQSLTHPSATQSKPYQYTSNAKPPQPCFQAPSAYSQMYPHNPMYSYYYQYNHPYNQMYGNQQYYANANTNWMNMYAGQQYFYNFNSPMVTVQANSNQYNNNNNHNNDRQEPRYVNKGNNAIQNSFHPLQPQQQLSTVMERTEGNNTNNEARTKLEQINDDLQSQLFKIKNASQEGAIHSTNLLYDNFKKSTDSDAGAAAAAAAVIPTNIKKNRNNPFLDYDDDDNLIPMPIPQLSAEKDRSIADVETIEFQKFLDKFSNMELNACSSESKASLIQEENSSNLRTGSSGSSLCSSSNKTETSSDVKSKENKIKINIKTTKEQLKNMSSRKQKSSKKTEVRNDKICALETNEFSLNKMETPKSDALPEIIDLGIIKLLDFPNDVATFNDKIPSMEIPSDIKDALYFPLFIAEIYNPFKFWFHYLKDDGNELDILMQNIEHVYSDLDLKTLQMHTSNIRPGQVCAALYLNTKLWHRAEILEDPFDDKVKVFFVDYGTVSYVLLKNIKYLMKDFCKLPSQALRGCLSHITPVSYRWTRDATYCFLDLVSEVMLYAKPTEIDSKENIIRMILIDTNGEKEFNINEMLVIKGHALYCPEYSNELHEESTCVNRRKHFQERYPSHRMLEKGEHPSFTEIGEYLLQGIDFESMQDENILNNVGDDDIIAYTAKLLCCTSDSDSDSSDINNDDELTTHQELEPIKITSCNSIEEDPDSCRMLMKENNNDCKKITDNKYEDYLQYHTSKNEESSETILKPEIMKDQQIFKNNNNSLSHSSSSNNVTNISSMNYPSVKLIDSNIRPPPGFEHIQRNPQNINF